MEKIFYILIFIILLLLLNLILLNDEHYVLINDLNYFEKFSEKNVLTTLINNNLIEKPLNKKNKILFITYDNRKKEDYIKIHNHNITAYTKKWGYEYKFYNNCNENVYWCKIYMVLDALNKNIYDYVVWMDSDTVIKNFDIDIGNVLNRFSSDIFIGSDNNPKYDITNSGVFIVKNSTTGINFLNDCINEVSNKCINNDGSLKGMWAASCYEQGIINLVIADKYQQYTTILTNKFIFNYNKCSNDVFIMHLYASSPSYRKKCFISNNPALKKQL